MASTIRCAVGLVALFAMVGCKGSDDPPRSDLPCEPPGARLACCCGASFGMTTCTSASKAGRCNCGSSPYDAAVPEIPPDPAGDSHLDFVLAWRWIPETPSTALADVPGLDLDRHNTHVEADPIGCGLTDATGGVDNQLVALAAQITSPQAIQDLDQTTQARTGAGMDLLVVRISGVGDSRDDGDVTVELHRGSVPPGASLETRDVTAAGTTITAIAPDQRIAMEATPLVRLASAHLASGRLWAEGGELPLVLATSCCGMRTVTLRDLRLVADLSAQALDAGLLAGAIDVEEVVSAAQLLGTFQEPVVRSIVASQADVLPEPATCSLTYACNRLSAAFLFGAVPATIE